jgi:hypothetical protein
MDHYMPLLELRMAGIEKRRTLWLNEEGEE